MQEMDTPRTSPYQLLTVIPEAVCILDPRALVIQANQAFLNLTGYSKEEVESSFSLEKLIYKKIFRNLQKRLLSLETKQYIKEEVRLLRKNRALREIELTISKNELAGQPVFICTLYDIASHKELERELRHKIAQERQKVNDTANAVLCIKQLLEKLHFLPLCFQELEKCQTASELLEKTVHWMSQHNGLKYFEVAIFIKKGEHLELGYANRECPLRCFHLSKSHKLAQTAKQTPPGIAECNGEYLLPILSPYGLEGVLQAFVDETERVLWSENESLKQAQQNLLQILVQFLGLGLAYFRLSEEQKHYLWEDHLTGFYNSVYIQEHIAVWGSTYKPLAVILLQIDGKPELLFTQPEIIREISGWIKKYSPPPTILGRIKDEVFVLLIPQMSLLEALNWVERLQKKFSLSIDCGYGHNSLLWSIVSYDPEITPSSLWTYAFACLEQGKQSAEQGKIFYWQNGVRKFTKGAFTKLN